MGALDDAIREHLELKRRHGASDEEIKQAEAEALGPARRLAPEHELDEAGPPGSDWLFLKLYVPPARQDGVISGPVRAFADEVTSAGDADLWFFVRYAD